jgi:hypothetical protein
MVAATRTGRPVTLPFVTNLYVTLPEVARRRRRFPTRQAVGEAGGSNPMLEIRQIPSRPAAGLCFRPEFQLSGFVAALIGPTRMFGDDCDEDVLPIHGFASL